MHLYQQRFIREKICHRAAWKTYETCIFTRIEEKNLFWYLHDICVWLIVKRHIFFSFIPPFQFCYSYTFDIIVNHTEKKNVMQPTAVRSPCAIIYYSFCHSIWIVRKKKNVYERLYWIDKCDENNFIWTIGIFRIK
jgi:hypothetical protein